ncbi:response regulator transcription factor [Saccharopolyspora indica]|uniref:response regulator transcription factor n=1 Tax=Saccharopolyspora indica TaxID=1229659 RepID=UPI0022EB360F|nr:response regulator transcription factor [Saccharopolyspora indica]MDA3646864.1 response regulator transcription factor [Saccharopolyspora indica]
MPGRSASESGGACPPRRGRRVLVVEDDPTVAQVITGYLGRAGFVPVVAADGVTGLELAESVAPDLVVLDVMLPGLDGIGFCRELRSRSRVPVIMVTSLTEEEDRLRGLEVGADDYLTKPFSPRELVLRVQAVLRRSDAMPPRPAGGVLRAGDLVVDRAARVATKGGRPLNLKNKEFELLVFLLGNPGRVVRRDELMRAVWAQEFGDASTVTVHVRRLREKIEDDPSRPGMLMTVWGVGYRFDLPR